MAEESHENFSNFDLAFGLEMSEGENQINQNLNQRMKTTVRRKTGPARRDGLPWSKAKIDLDSYTGTQNNSDKKRISLAELACLR